MTPEELEKWLEGRPEETRQQEAVWIAHRCAMRVLPDWWRSSRVEDLTATTALRASLISGVASLVPTPEIRLAAAPAFNAARAGPIFDAPDAAGIAVKAARADADAASEAAAADATARDAADAARAATDAALARDVDWLKAGNPPGDLPLWPDPVPDLGWADWQRDSASRPNGPWNFWTDWYRRAHDGLPQPMDLLEKTAFQPDEFWQGTDGEVNVRIADLVADWEGELAAERLQLLAEVRALREEIRSHRAGVASPVVRASNLPEDMEPLDVIDADMAKLDVELFAAEAELEQGQPSKSRLKSIAAALGRMSMATLSYIGKMANKAVETAVVEGTKRAVQATTIVVGAGIADRVFNISEAIMKFADKIPWL